MKKGVMYTFGASIILIICFIAFVLPSSLSRTAQQQEGLVFGKYNGKKISYEYGSDFTEFLSQYAQLIRNQGQEITQSNQYALYSYAFNSTVIKYAQEEALKKAGYEVPQDSINLKIKNYFTDSDGKFSKKAYKQADPSYIETITKSIRDSLYTGRYYDDNFGSTETFAGKSLFGLKSSSAEQDFINNTFDQEKRAFKLITFKISDFPREEQAKFGKNNADLFTKHDMSIITVESKDIADKVASRLSKGQITFEDAVAEYSDKNYSDSEGKLTNNSQYQIKNVLNDKADIDKINAIAEGEVSPVVQTLMGYSIFKRNGASTKPDFDSDDTLSDVLNYIKIYETSVIEDYYVEVAKKFVKEAKASDVDTAVANYADATVYDVPAFALNYGPSPLYDSVDTNTIQALASADKNAEFFEQAFSIKLNDFSEPLIMSENVAVLKLTEIIPSEKDAEPADNTSKFVDFDQTASQNAVMQSPKFENNFLNVYFENFLSSSY